MRKPTVLLLALVVLLQGCGPSLVEFAAQADALCAARNRVIDALSAPDSVAKIKEYSEKLAAETNGLATSVSALKKPRGDDGAKVDAFVKDVRAGGAKATALGQAAAKEDLPGIEKSAAEVKTAFQKVDDTARAAGFKACGKSGVTSTTNLANATPGILKNAYIAKADARCAAATKESEAIPEPSDNATLAQAVEYLDKIIALAQALLTDLKAMVPPAADKAAVDEVWSDNDKFIAKLAEGRDAARAEQSDRADALFEEAFGISAQADVKADRFGFRDCGSAGSS